MTIFTTQNLILAVGVLLLVGPTITRAATAWFYSAMGHSPDRRDFEKQTVAELLELKERFAKYGNPTAERLCRDLVYAVVYGDSPSNP